MEQHLLISSLIESLVYFNNSLMEINSQVYNCLSAYSFSSLHFYDVDLELLEYKLNYLMDLYKDKNLKVKSKHNSNY